MLDQGRIVAEGSPRELVERYVSKEVLEVRLRDGGHEALTAQLTGEVARVELSLRCVRQVVVTSSHERSTIDHRYLQRAMVIAERHQRATGERFVRHPERLCGQLLAAGGPATGSVPRREYAVEDIDLCVGRLHYDAIPARLHAHRDRADVPRQKPEGEYPRRDIACRREDGPGVIVPLLQTHPLRGDTRLKRTSHRNRVAEQHVFAQHTCREDPRQQRYRSGRADRRWTARCRGFPAETDGTQHRYRARDGRDQFEADQMHSLLSPPTGVAVGLAATFDSQRRASIRGRYNRIRAADSPHPRCGACRTVPLGSGSPAHPRTTQERLGGLSDTRNASGSHGGVFRLRASSFAIIAL